MRTRKSRCAAIWSGRNSSSVRTAFLKYRRLHPALAAQGGKKLRGNTIPQSLDKQQSAWQICDSGQPTRPFFACQTSQKPPPNASGRGFFTSVGLGVRRLYRQVATQSGRGARKSKNSKAE